MSRTAKLITLDEFKKRIEKLVDSGGFPYDLPKKIEDDLAKVNFDWENYNMGEADPCYKEEYASDYNGFAGYPCGYEVLDNGLPVLFVNAGGDWEHPICFVFYFDGKTMRAYIPTDGNIYNKKEKCAYGSEESCELPEDLEATDGEYPDCDAEAIRRDVINRIKIEGVSEGWTPQQPQRSQGPRRIIVTGTSKGSGEVPITRKQVDTIDYSNMNKNELSRLIDEALDAGDIDRFNHLTKFL